MKRITGPRVDLVLVTVLALAAAPASGQVEAPEVFRPIAGEKALALDSPAATASYRLAVDTRVLGEGPRVVSFVLPDGQAARATAGEVELRAPGDLAWRGTIDGVAGSQVTLSVKGGLMAGLIVAAGEVYELSPLPDGGHRLEAIDQSRLPPCGGAVDPAAEIPALAPGGGHQGPQARSDSGPGVPAVSLRDSAGQIDLLGLYTPQARGQAGGAAQIVARLQASVDVANTALRNSDVHTRFRLVATALANHDDSGSLATDLRWLAQDPTVAALRNQHRADLVGMMTGVGDFCGIGYLMQEPGPSFAPFGFQVTRLFCAVALLTYAHEHGHNMGLEHDPDNGSPPAEASYPWSFGHFVSGVFTTVMSYSTGCAELCARVPHFSNPEVAYLGLPTGIAGERDNHRTLNLVAGIVANFRGGGGGGGPAGPPAPGNLEVARDGLAALLSWEDRATNESGYRVYRGPQGGALAVLAELPADSIVFRDDGLAPGSSYDYQVAAFNAQGESRSARVSLTVPAPQPVGVTLVLPEPPIAAGALLSFAALTTGPVDSAVWSFGAEGIAASPEPCGTDRYCASHLFAEPGSHRVAVEVRGDLGQTDAAEAVVEVLGPAPELAVRRGFVQSVLFGPRGATGTFESNCWAHNSGGEPALVEFTYLPRGAGNPDPERRAATLRSGETLFVANVLASLFGEADSQGSLGLAYVGTSAAGPAGLPEAATHCRSFVALRGQPGSFGQLVGEEPETTWSAAPKVAAGILDEDGWSATLLAANLDGAPGVVSVDLTDAAGAPVGAAQPLALGARTMRSRPLAQLFPEASGRTGPFTARFTSSGIRFAASFTLLEAGSEDQIFVAAREPQPGNPLFVPRVATSESQFGAFLVSRLIARNNAPSATTLTFELWLRGQANLAPPTATAVIPAGGVLVVPDLVGDLFGLPTGVGALRIHWQNAEGVAPRILTLSLNERGSGGRRFGMLIDSRDPASAGGSALVSFGAEQSPLFRADYGVLNLSPGPTLVEVRLREADGSLRATAQLGLAPQQHLERNLAGIFREPPLGEGSNWTVEARVLAGGPIMTYLANTNVSGDIFFVPGLPVEP